MHKNALTIWRFNISITIKMCLYIQFRDAVLQRRQSAADKKFLSRKSCYEYHFVTMTNAQARRPSRCPPSAFRMQQNVPPLPKDDAVLDLKVFVESGGDHLEHHQHIARSDGWRPVPVRPSWMNPVETHIGSNEGQGQFLPMLNGYVFPNRKTSQTVKRSSWPFWFLFCLFFDLGRTNGRTDLKTCTARIVIVWYVRV